MTRLAAYTLAALVPVSAVAQDDKGLLTRFLEEQLSDAGRAVEIEGFQGALSAQATIDRLTIADDGGPWLVLEGLVLDWNRAAVLRGEIQIGELSAQRIAIPRLPQTEPGPPSPAASEPFRLPELPISVEIGRLGAERVELGAPLLGEAVVLSAEGALSLIGGSGAADLAIRRIDGPSGAFVVDAGFDNGTTVLALDLALNEGPGGIVSTSLGLPGAPSVDLKIAGEAPLDAFESQLRLATDGQDRLTGTATTTVTEDTRGFSLVLDGDISPLLAPDYRPFFGDAVSLTAQGAQEPEGQTRLDQLTLRTEAMTLTGALTLAPGGVPERFDLNGQIGAGGAPVRLPIPGAGFVRGAEISAQFDAAQGDSWSAEARLDGFQGDGLALETATLSGTGIIEAEGPRVTAQTTFRAEGFAHPDAALVTALGTVFDGAADLTWQGGAPLELRSLTLAGTGYGLMASGTLDGEAPGLPVSGTAEARFDDLSRLAPLTGLDLSGAARADLAGQGALSGGAFDLELTAATTDLALGEPRLDQLIRGASSVTLSAKRDTTGLDLRAFRIDANELQASAQGRLTTDGADLDLTARLSEIAPFVPGLSGPVTLDGAAKGDATLWDLDLTGQAPGGVALRFDGIYRPAPNQAEGRLTADLPDAAAFAELAGRPLAGALSIDAEGTADLAAGSAEAEIALTGSDLALGQAELDRLLAGQSRVSATIAGTAERVAVETLTLSAPALSARGSGLYAAGESWVRAEARLTDLALLREGLAGPATVTLRADETQAGWTGEADLGGPGGTELRLSGDIAGDTAKGRASGRITDLAPFSALAGRDLAGSTALDLTGEAGLSDGRYSVTGTLTASGLDLGSPELNRLLADETRIALAANGAGESVTIDQLDLRSDLLTASLSGQLAETSTVALEARLTDLAALVPGFPGPAQISAEAMRDTGPWRLEATAQAPGGTDARVAGSLAEDFATADLTLTGGAELALANRFIAPRSVAGPLRFDLRLNGAPGLATLSGQVSTSGARVALPTVGTALDPLEATVSLNGGQAQVDLGARVREGGQLRLSGPVSLTAPYPADLALVLDGVALVDPGLYQSSIDGQLSVSGPLTGGGMIAGQLELGRTEVQVPSTGLASAGDLPAIRHVNEPAAVRQTRARAGLIQRSAPPSGSGRFGLDLSLLVANPIFVRGRGLDAEFGGSLQLGGNTAQVVATGRFDLARGRLDILGKRLVIEEGFAQLEGDFSPYIRLVAVSRGRGVTVRVIIDGPAEAPQISFVSEPELPEDQVLAQLLFERDLTTLSPLQAAQLASAVATLAGQGGAGIVGRLRQNFGLDDLDISSDESGETTVRAGRYLSENIYTDVEIGADGSSEVNLNLDLTPNLSVRGSAGSDGATGLGLFFQKDY